MDPSSRELLIANYRRRFREHSDAAEAVQMSAAGQAFRFKKLCEIGDLSGRSILDVGCGLGALYSFLAEQVGPIDYCGIDILPEFVEAARARFPAARFLCHDLLTEPLDEKFDFVLLSSVFNNAALDADEYMECLLTRAFAQVRVGLGFNFISDRVNFRDDTMAYHEPERVLGFGLRHLSNKIVLEHHYERCDVAVFVYK